MLFAVAGEDDHHYNHQRRHVSVHQHTCSHGEQATVGRGVVLHVAGISVLGGIVVKSLTEVSFCETKLICGAAFQVPLMVDAPDYRVKFDAVR